MAKKLIRIGSRGSRLALWQAHFVKDQLEGLGHEVEIIIIKTKGDQIQNLSFDKIEGKGFFTKELETALLECDVDLAVHSYKDLPTEQPEGLTLAANSYRENPADWLLMNESALDKKLALEIKKGATVGTSSARRKAQLLALRPDLKVVPIRGNVPTRVGKLNEQVDAVILAAAGLQRLALDLSGIHLHELPTHQFVPAPAQGVLAYQIRKGDAEMEQVLQSLHDPSVGEKIAIERTILQKLEGGCQQPIGVYCKKESDNFLLWASKAASENHIPKQIFLKGNNAKVLVSECLPVLTAQQAKTIFISRDLEGDSSFRHSLEAQGHSIHAESLIEFEGVSFQKPNSSDWVFFSSPRAVHHFFKGIDQLDKKVKIAAMGAGTASTLVALGIECDFVGQSADTEQVAAHFLQKAKGGKVLFPIASHSRQSIQKHLTDHITVENLVIYNNTPKTSFDIPTCDILVFTSPKNVETYLTQYKIAADQTLIAIGPSTASTLEKYGYTSYRVAYQPDEISLAALCY